VILVGIRKNGEERIYIPDTLPLKDVISFIEEIGGGSIHHRPEVGAVEIRRGEPWRT